MSKKSLTFLAFHSSYRSSQGYYYVYMLQVSSDPNNWQYHSPGLFGLMSALVRQFGRIQRVRVFRACRWRARPWRCRWRCRRNRVRAVAASHGVGELRKIQIEDGNHTYDRVIDICLYLLITYQTNMILADTIQAHLQYFIAVYWQMSACTIKTTRDQIEQKINVHTIEQFEIRIA